MAYSVYVDDPRLDQDGVTFEAKISVDYKSVNDSDPTDSGNYTYSVVATPSVGVSAWRSAVISNVNTQTSGLTLSRIVFLSDMGIPQQTQSPATRSFTTGTGATGFQISATQASNVRYGVTIQTAATLAAGAVGTVVLEVAPTNSATASDWKEIGRITNGQVFSLAVAIGCTQTIAGQLNAYVPAGYYVKLRTINTTGTPTYTFNAGTETLIG